MNKTYIYKGMAMLAFVSAMASCEEDTLPTNFAPTVTTGGTEDIYRTGVKSVSGTIANPNGYTVEEYGIEYSSFQSFAEPEKVIATDMDGQGNFSIGIEGLEPGQGYFYRTYVFGGHNTIYGEARNFTTETTTPPQFGKETKVSNVGLTSFNVEATLLDDGGAEGGIQMRAFIYMPVASEEVTDLTMGTPNVNMQTVTEYNTTINDVDAGTLYAVRPVAIAGSGIGYGTIAYVTTTATDRTLLSECTLSDTTINSIDVAARILAEGTHPIVETGFCYSSESQTPTVEHLTVQATPEGRDFKATLTGMNAATTYYIRAYAKNDQGTVEYSETKIYAVADHQDLDVMTNNADEISAISARLWGNIRNNNVPVRERGICWSATDTNPTVDNATRVVVDTDAEKYSITIDTEFNTTYYFCAYGKNSKGDVYYGEVLSFTTPDISEPTLVMQDATEITDSTANVSATFTLNYEYRANYNVKCGLLLCIGTDKEPTLENHDAQIVCDKQLEAHLTSDVIEVPFGGKFRELQYNTDYCYRAYVQNEKGLVYSDVRTFKTLKYTPNSGDAPFPEVNN